METNEAIKMLAAIAQESRLMVFRHLATAANPVNVGSLADAIGIPGNTLSFHLKELTAAGLLKPKRQGRTILYALNEENVAKLMGFLLKDCCSGRPNLCGFDFCEPTKPSEQDSTPKRTVKKKPGVKQRL